MSNKSVLIIGSGGREHALGWKLKQSSQVGKIYFAPGNAGTAKLGENVSMSVINTELLLEFAKKNKIDLTVVGPDDALAAGVVNIFQKDDLKIFGPTQEAAQIEASKAFAKQLMLDEGIPTAAFATFTNAHEALHYLRKQSMPTVIKASGLALGKGVIIAQTLTEAEKAVEDIMVKKIFGKAGDKVIIEEFLEGPEVSIHAFCDGETAVLFPSGKDHKTIFENNKGPNTGGMGTIAPVPEINGEFLEQVKQTIVLPVLRGLKKRGIKFSGLLYPGLMLTKNGPKVLEFNARFGDPETQSYMRLLESDLFDIFMSCCNGTLSKQKIVWSANSACCIVLASAGYPGTPQKGDVIEGLDKVAKDIQIFHAGTVVKDGKVVTNGGRVLGITAIGKDLKTTLKKAYSIIGKKGVYFAEMQVRKDIGAQVL